MTYAAAVDHLYALGQELAPVSPGGSRRKFDLKHMKILAEALGNPQGQFRSILIGGTNGKGSTAASLASILVSSGYKTALYTSPHLIRVNERIQVSTSDALPEDRGSAAPETVGSPHLVQIADEDFARIYFLVDGKAKELVAFNSLPHPPSFFEILTAIAFVYFAEQRVDTAVLEVGLGGRLDATNIVDPLISILTDIALDHQDYLGDTLAEITREKVGILRPYGTLVTLPQHPEANQTIGEAAAAMAGLRAVSAADLMPTPNQLAHSLSPAAKPLLPANSYELTVDGEPLLVDSPLSGAHQQRNLALAIQAALELRNNNSYNISNQDIARGITGTQWPGRLELIPPMFLLDVAHNPAGAWTLRSVIAHLPDDLPRTLVFSCLRDKNLVEMAQILFPLFDASTHERHKDHLILAPIDNPRAADVKDLVAAALALKIPAHASPHVAGALAQAKEVTPPNGLIVITGSIYLIGQVRGLVMGQK